MSATRIIVEARGAGGVHRVEKDARHDNWLDEKRNQAEVRQGVVEATNDLLRALNLTEIKEADQ